VVCAKCGSPTAREFTGKWWCRATLRGIEMLINAQVPRPPQQRADSVPTVGIAKTGIAALRC
jgi:hypothetical protein